MAPGSSAVSGWYANQHRLIKKKKKTASQILSKWRKSVVSCGKERCSAGPTVVFLTQHWTKCLGAKGIWLLSWVSHDEGVSDACPLVLQETGEEVLRIILSILAGGRNSISRRACLRCRLVFFYCGITIAPQVGFYVGGRCYRQPGLDLM